VIAVSKTAARSLSPLLEHLRGLEVVPTPSPAVLVTPTEALLERYSVYLFEERGLSASSVRNYVGVARLFLSEREAAAGALELEGLTSAAVSEFVLGECRRCSVGSAKCMATKDSDCQHPSGEQVGRLNLPGTRRGSNYRR
jgi:hypothetical protein